MKILAIALTAALLTGCGAAERAPDTRLSGQEEIVAAFEDNRQAFEDALAFLQEDGAAYGQYRRTADGVAAHDYGSGKDAPLAGGEAAPVAALFDAAPVQEINWGDDDVGFHATFEFYFEDMTAPDSACAATFASGVGYGAMEYMRHAEEIDGGWYYYEDFHP